MDRQHILLVDDDVALLALVRVYLGERGFAVSCESRGDRVVERVRAERPDVIVLDIGLPGLDGLEVCKRLREFHRGPILMLTARGEPSDEVRGLDLGADDYVAKPVKPTVLVARLKALLRRDGADRPVTAPLPTVRVTLGALVVDPAAREARLADALLDLTSGEFDLLWVLAANAGEVVTREKLLEALRGESYDGFDRSIDVRVSKLRQKLGAAASAVKTVRGVGYLLARPGRGSE